MYPETITLRNMSCRRTVVLLLMWSPDKKKFGDPALNKLNKQLQGVFLGRQQKGCFVTSKLRENLQ